MVLDSKNNNDSSAPASHIPTTSSLHPNIYQQMNSNTSLFMNPHAVAQAATAALAAAAQQVAQQAKNNQNVQQQQGIVFPPKNLTSQQNADSSNANVTSQIPNQKGNQTTPQTSNIPTNKLNGTLSSLSETVPVVPPVTQNAQTFSNNPQQIAINAQAAALIAAGGINPLLLNSGNIAPAHATTMAAFASLIQSQQQQQGPQHQQTISTTAPQYQEQQNSSAVQNSDNSTPIPSNPLIQHFNHSTKANSTVLNGRNQQINKMNKGNDSLTSLMTYKVPTIKRPKNVNQNVPTQATQQQPQSNVNSMYAAASNNPIFFAQMQNWKLEQLEAHCHLLRETSQTIPQPVSLLLAEARRREEKRTAKRVANRKSACTSRARKKAFVEEMTKTNARLRRQAVILSLLPDLVIAIKLNGDITFCSAQVGRVLRHSVESLVGASINDILIPSSQKELSRLIKKLAAAEKAALDENNKEGDESRRSSNSGNQSTTAIVSEQSDRGFPPLSVVKVNSCSSVTSCYRSSSEIAPRNSHTDDVTGASVTANNAGARLSSLQHKPDGKKHRDDVTGASVTANNAGARLSSLQHKLDDKKSMKESNFESQEDVSSSTSTDSLFAGVEDKRKAVRGDANEPVSDDSGYRESGESASREDSSSTSDTSNGGRPRPLAPTCNICLIRNDLSTIWCEVTSSIRTRSLNEENLVTPITASSSPVDKKRVNGTNTMNGSESTSDDDQVKELLLCLRPIRDGDNKVGSKFKFVPGIKKEQEGVHHDDAIITQKVEMSKSRPMKKRPLPASDLRKCEKKPALDNSGSEAEKSVVESLILMSSHKQQTG